MLSAPPKTSISWSTDRSTTPLAWSRSSRTSSRTWVKSSGRANSTSSMPMPSWTCSRSSSSIRLSLNKRRLKWMLSSCFQSSLFPSITDWATLRDCHSSITLLVWITSRIAIQQLATSCSILLTCFKSRVFLLDRLWSTILESRIFIYLMSSLSSKSFLD